MTDEVQAWRNRIVGSGELLVQDALFNPDNWRIHPRQQQEAVEEVLDKVGWVQQVVVNKRTNRLVDGHLRVTLADRRGEAVVPCIFVDLTEEEEKLVLASLDSTTSLAVPDSDKLNELIESIGVQEGALGELFASLSSPDLAALARPDFSGLVEDLTGAHAPSAAEGDGNWFYVEFYGQDELYGELRALMDEALSQHNLDPQVFEQMVRKHYGE